MSNVVISGVGITSSIGQGQTEFVPNLLAGKQAFTYMKRPGRQSRDSQFIGAEVNDLHIPSGIESTILRTASLSAKAALATLSEAWSDAELSDVDAEKMGIIVSGSNFQQREIANTFAQYADNPEYIRPSYAVTFMDTDVLGLCSEQFGIRGFGFSLGGASASGQLAVIQAAQSIASGQADVCVVVGTLMDISHWECHAFRSIGAMGSDRFSQQPALACRPFDRDSDGFIYGESCGVLILESEDHALSRAKTPYARVKGWSTHLDGNRNPNPSVEGEVKVIRGALAHANLGAQDIKYINPHGTGSPVGDKTEVQAILECGLEHAYINATKSIVGHGLCSAGVTETVATILQMEASALHPSLNMLNPIHQNLNWVGAQKKTVEVTNVLKMSHGFGGINSAICLEKWGN